MAIRLIEHVPIKGNLLNTAPSESDLTNSELAAVCDSPDHFVQRNEYFLFAIYLEGDL